jgi:peptidoglycan/LPS O-acetylase OafA/YrhL
MNRTRPFRPARRLAGILAALATVLLTVAAAAAPAAFADPVPPIGGGGTVAPPPPAQVVVAGGMPGWQIALIAVGAAILAAAVAVFLDRARTARRHQAAPGT